MLGNVFQSDLVGADDEHDAVHVGLRAHFLFHLAQPAVQSVEALTQADVVHQQDALTVLVELVTHLKPETTEAMKRNTLKSNYFICFIHKCPEARFGFSAAEKGDCCRFNWLIKVKVFK